MRLSRLQGLWDEWGRRDPMYVILIDESKRGGKWDPDEFFATGPPEIDAVMATIERLGVNVARRRALDFGCGLGRLTQALGAYFDRCDGVDIAPSMIEQARRYNRFGPRCQYHVNGASDLSLFADETFDLVYTTIVLQHLEPRWARNYIREFFRVLAPGGVAVFQVPSQLNPGYRGRSWAAWINRSPSAVLWCARLGNGLARLRLCWRAGRSQNPAVYMSPVPRAQVERIIAASGVQLLGAFEDGCSGPEWIAYKYFVQKPGRGSG